MSTPNNPAQFWNERYNAPEYAYGVEPNRYFQSVLDQFQGQPGRMLLPAEGEGRNAVYAALKGWKVTGSVTQADWDAAIHRLELLKNVVMNPYSHPSAPNIPKQEVTDAIAAVTAFLDLVAKK